MLSVLAQVGASFSSGTVSAWKWDAAMSTLTVPSGQHAQPVLCLAALTGWSEAALATGGRDKKVVLWTLAADGLSLAAVDTVLDDAGTFAWPVFALVPTAASSGTAEGLIVAESARALAATIQGTRCRYSSFKSLAGKFCCQNRCTSALQAV